MKWSGFVGTISEKRELYKVSESGEKFYITDVYIGDIKVPAVGSEYVLRDISGKKYIKCYIRSEMDDGHLFTFLNILCIEICHDENVQDTNLFIVSGLVLSSKGIKPKWKDALEVLPFIVKYYTHDKNKNIVHCVAYGENARKLSDIAPRDVIDVTGKLKVSSGTFELEVVTVNYIRRNRKGNETATIAEAVKS